MSTQQVGTPAPSALGATISTAEIEDDAVTAAKLADTAVTPGSYTNTALTVDQQGRLTAAASGTAPYVPGGTDVAVADGGTGSSTAANARTALGLAIGTDIPALAHAHTSAGTGGQLTDAALSAAVGVAKGGTGSTTASDARIALGVVIGTNVQAYDADLDTLAGKTIPSGATLADTSSAQTFTTKTLTAPVIADFTNAAHDHADADDGGQISGATALSEGVTGTGAFVRAAAPTFTSTVQTAGNVGIGVAPSAVSNEFLTIASADDAATSIKVTNSNAAGTTARGVIQVSSDSAVMQVQSHGTARPPTRFGVAVGGYSELVQAGAGNGLLIGTTHASPVIVGTSSMAGFQLNGTNPHPSFPQSDKRVASPFSAAGTTTLATVTGLTVNVTAGKTYRFRAVLNVDADATGGHKYAIAGTCTATAVEYQINSINNATNAFRINSRQTALGGASGEAIGTAYYTEINGMIVVNAAGTLLVQFAQNTATGTSTVRALSLFTVVEVQ